MAFDFDEEKNQLLFAERGISFQNVIDAIYEKGILADFAHPNKTKYSNQRIFVIEFEDYTYCVPYVENESEIFLKTIYPSRKFLSLLGGKSK